MTTYPAPSDGISLSEHPDGEALDYATEEEGSGWGRIDLSAVLDGTWKQHEPTLMRRTDGHALLYPGLVHSLQGESESGKSFVAQAEAARQLKVGARVLYLDFESDQGTVVTRMLQMGAEPAAILERLDYRRPDTLPNGSTMDAAAFIGMLRNKYALAVIDGVTEAFSVFGVSSVDNDEVTTWGREVPRKIAERTGAAVVLIDHVTKATEGRGRFAIGAQAKMSYLTGASYTVEVIEPLGVGMVGTIALRVGKDRPGMVRPHSGDFRKSDRTQEAGVVIIDSTEPGVIGYKLHPPYRTQPREEIPSELLEKLSRAFQDAGSLTAREYRAAVKAKAATVDKAVKILEAGGYITRPTSSGKLTHFKPYQSHSEPVTDSLAA
ncbi:AAA family ATPase [Kocuria sabuli]|uniref:AAA family ATPase n=1 Tax=Kocuria sabuli TaxID=3071448 RepID=UPI0034D5374F